MKMSKKNRKIPIEVIDLMYIQWKDIEEELSEKLSNKQFLLFFHFLASHGVQPVMKLKQS